MDREEEGLEPLKTELEEAGKAVALVPPTEEPTGPEGPKPKVTPPEEGGTPTLPKPRKTEPEPMDLTEEHVQKEGEAQDSKGAPARKKSERS